ncbi:MAG: VOC family protein [Actinomycetota bacterium]|nr:VOC family protein [Actinomycetota bacterium]
MASDPEPPSVYPTLTYSDAAGAIRFLTEAFGFSEVAVHPGPDNTIAHAQLGWRNGLIMLSSRSKGPSPFDVGPACIYLVVDDPDGHHDRSVTAGAEIVMGLTDQDYGSREYAARDSEGNLWCFGTYRPSPKPAPSDSGPA